jgi:hypothetical protein
VASGGRQQPRRGCVDLGKGRGGEAPTNRRREARIVTLTVGGGGGSVTMMTSIPVCLVAEYGGGADKRNQQVEGEATTWLWRGATEGAHATSSAT